MLVTRLKWVVFALVFFGIIISYIDRGNLSIAAKPVLLEMNLSPESLGALLSSFFVTYALFQLPAGYLVDRFGIRLCYAVAFTIWSVASASIALSRGPGDIVASRLLLGAAESVGPIASLTFIRRYFAVEARGVPTALYIGGQTLGPAIGTVVGAAVIMHYGWRPLFGITGLGALIWVPLWLVFAPRSEAGSRGQTEDKVGILSVLNMSSAWLLGGAIFFSSYFWWFVMTWMPGYLTMARGLSTADMGRTFSLPLFAMTATNLILGWIADRYVARSGRGLQDRVRFGSAGLILASSVLLLNVQAVPILPILFVCICGFGLASASIWTIAQGMVDASAVGRFIGVLNTLSQIAGIAAPLITGWTVGRNQHFYLAIWAAGIAPLLAGACLLAVGHRRRVA